MSMDKCDVDVKWIKIQWADNDKPIMYNNEAIIGIRNDTQNRIKYIRIGANGKLILSESLDTFKWAAESSTTGVATIISPAVKIIIAYDSKKRKANEFFDQLRDILENGRRTPSPDPTPSQNNNKTEDSTQMAIEDLLESINTRSSNDAVHAAKYLIETRAKIQFNLISQNNNQEKKSLPAEASSDILRLKLRVESHLNKEPLTASICVCSGSTLRELKARIEDETDIKRDDQYWYAFDRYMIPDDYEFGSSAPVVPKRRNNAPKTQPAAPEDPIQSGDTLILYIAQIRPFL